MKNFATQTLANFKGLDLTAEGVDSTENDFYLSECVNFEISDRGSLVKRPGIRAIGRNLPATVDSPVILGKVKTKLVGQYEPLLVHFENSNEIWGLLDTDQGVGWVKLHANVFSAPIRFGRNEIINMGGASYFPGSLNETGTGTGLWKYSHTWNATSSPTDSGVLSVVNPSPRCCALALLTDRFFALDPYSFVGEDRVYYSGPGTYEVWNLSLDYISFKEVHITNIVEFKERLAIFSNNKIWLLDTTQGGPTAWSKTIYSHNLGSYTYEGTVSYNGWLYFLDNTGLYRTDYSTIELLSTKLNRLFARRDPNLYNIPNNLDCIAAYNDKIYMTVNDEYGLGRTFVYDLFRETWTEFAYRYKTATLDTYGPGTNFTPILTGSRDRLGYFPKKGGGAAGVVEPGLYMTPYNTANSPVEKNKSVYLFVEDEDAAVRTDSDTDFIASFKTQRLLFKQDSSVKRCPELDLWYSTKDRYDLMYTTDDSHLETVPLETVPGISEGIDDWGVQRVRGPSALFRNLQVQVRTIGEEQAEFGALVFKYRPYNTMAYARPAISEGEKIATPGITEPVIPPPPEIWHYVGTPGEPAFGGGWRNYGFGWRELRFRKDQGVVHLQGLITGGTPGVTLFTLPEGYRPTPAPNNYILYNGSTYTDPGRIDIGSNGDVVLDPTVFTSDVSVNLIFPVDDVVWHYIGGAGEPAFKNSWINYGGIHIGARFTKKLDVVYAQGLVGAGTIGEATPMFTLPAGYTQDREMAFTTISAGPHWNTRTDITAGGDFQPADAKNGWYSLTGINYPVIDPGLWHYVGSPGEPGYTNGWSAHGAFGPSRFTKQLDVVYMQGLVTGGTAGTAIFQLPAEYRPEWHLIFPSHNWKAPIRNGRIEIHNNGNVVMNFGDNIYTALTLAYSVKI